MTCPSWLETGSYIFTGARPGEGWDWAGNHIHPRFRIAEIWHWPVGVSLSNEIGYQRHAFSTDTWTWEVRPIIDKKQGPWYWSFDPTFDRSLRGANVKKGFEFSPNFKISYDIANKAAGGFEYCGSIGPVTGFDPLKNQRQQLFPTINLHLSPQWEFNAGVGVGVPLRNAGETPALRQRAAEFKNPMWRAPPAKSARKSGCGTGSTGPPRGLRLLRRPAGSCRKSPGVSRGRRIAHCWCARS